MNNERRSRKQVNPDSHDLQSVGVSDLYSGPVGIFEDYDGPDVGDILPCGCCQGDHKIKKQTPATRVMYFILNRCFEAFISVIVAAAISLLVWLLFTLSGNQADHIGGFIRLGVVCIIAHWLVSAWDSLKVRWLR